VEPNVNTHLDEFTLVTLKSGMKSLRSISRQETFHPTSGPHGEATLLHVQQQRLVDRCASVKRFVIWDIGFGAAANVLAAIGALKGLETEIEIHSFDQTTSPIEFTLINANDLDYVVGYEAKIKELLLHRKVQISSHMTWYLHLGDFSEKVKTEYEGIASPHAIFFDPYSAATNPEMWTLENFSYLWKRLDPHEKCLWTNYTRSTAVRVALLLAGFYVGVGCIIGEKAETTIAANDLSLLERPLDRRWLERVRNSTNSAPLRTHAYSKSKISDEDFERLLKLEQFQMV
jgi:hypothetical protein